MEGSGDSRNDWKSEESESGDWESGEEDESEDYAPEDDSHDDDEDFVMEKDAEKDYDGGDEEGEEVEGSNLEGALGGDNGNATEYDFLGVTKEQFDLLMIKEQWEESVKMVDAGFGKDFVFDRCRDNVNFYLKMEKNFHRINKMDFVKHLTLLMSTCLICGETSQGSNHSSYMRIHIFHQHMETSFHTCELCGKKMQPRSKKQHEKTSHITPPEKANIFTLNPEGNLMDVHLFDGTFTNGLNSIHQLYAWPWFWKDENGTEHVVGVSINVTSLNDVKEAAKQNWNDNSRAAKQLDLGFTPRGCSSMFAINLKKWYQKPEKAAPLGIYGEGFLAGCTLKWIVRRIVGAVCHQISQYGITRTEFCRNEVISNVKAKIDLFPPENKLYIGQDGWKTRSLPFPTSADSPQPEKMAPSAQPSTSSASMGRAVLRKKVKKGKSVRAKKPAPARMKKLYTQEELDKARIAVLYEGAGETVTEYGVPKATLSETVGEKRPYSEKDMADAIEAVEGGAHVGDAAAEFFVNQTTLSHKTKHIVKKPKRKRINENDVKDALEEYSRMQTPSLGKIAKKYHMSKTTFHRYLKKFKSTLPTSNKEDDEGEEKEDEEHPKKKKKEK